MAPACSDFFHVLNPNSSRRPSVESFISKSGWPHVWIDRTSHPTHLETVLHWAVNEGRRDVAIWGGDGTFGRAVNALFSLNAFDKVRLALIPAGTCNDFARKLQIPLWDDIVKSGRILSERKCDVGLMTHAEGRWAFINNAGFGRRPSARRSQRPNPIMDILRLKAEPLHLSSPGGRVEREEIRALMGIVFNAPYFGGGLYFIDQISPEDGVLDAFFLEDQPRWRVLWSFTRGRNGRPFSNAGIYRVSGRTIQVRTIGTLYPQADGERASAGGVKEIEFGVLPAKLNLMVAE